MRSFICCAIFISCLAYIVSSAEEPLCLDVAKNPAIIKATMNFMMSAKNCTSDDECADIAEGGPFVCPPTMKICMPAIMRDRMMTPTNCKFTNLTTGEVKPDCVSGFRRSKATNQCEFRGPKLCTGDGDCASEQKCLEAKMQPFNGKRCYTPCDPDAEKIAEDNGWDSTCGMARHVPAGDRKARMQVLVGCHPTDKVCGLKIAREKLARLVKANKDNFIPPELQTAA